jgi:riboflavin synthase
MFTGLVEAVGQVERMTPDGHGGADLLVRAAAIASELQIGESIAVNGACLTVVEVAGPSFRFQLGPETLVRTNLGGLRVGEGVNLERALRVGDRLDGHWVQGHIDTVGRVVRRQQQGDWEFVEFACEPEWTKQMVPKGSIAVDGVSLTLVDVRADRFSVMLIPHTLAVTTLGNRPVGSAVNLETDLLAKYAQKQLAALLDQYQLAGHR